MINGTRAKAHGPGPWDKGQGPWDKAHGRAPAGRAGGGGGAQGPWAKAHGPSPMGQGPWARGHGPGSQKKIYFPRAQALGPPTAARPSGWRPPVALVPWALAHGPWPMALALSHGPWPMSLALSHGPWPMGPGPWPWPNINAYNMFDGSTRLNNFDGSTRSNNFDGLQADFLLFLDQKLFKIITFHQSYVKSGINGTLTLNYGQSGAS